MLDHTCFGCIRHAELLSLRSKVARYEQDKVLNDLQNKLDAAKKTNARLKSDNQLLMFQRNEAREKLKEAERQIKSELSTLNENVT